MKCISLARCSVFSASQRHRLIELGTNGRRAMIRGHSVLLEHTLRRTLSLLGCAVQCNARNLCMMNGKMIVTHYTLFLRRYYVLCTNVAYSMPVAMNTNFSFPLLSCKSVVELPSNRSNSSIRILGGRIDHGRIAPHPTTITLGHHSQSSRGFLIVE